MEKFWKDQSGNDESFWEHEWGKHGTCYSTLEPSCYTNYTAQEEVVNFFEQVVRQFKKLPTFEYLANAGIVPSSTKNYTNAEILEALYTPRGVNATIECDSDNQFYEVYYTFNVKGSVADGKFVPVNPVGEGNGCPATGIQYLPKQLDTRPAVNNTEHCAASLSSASAVASSIASATATSNATTLSTGAVSPTGAAVFASNYAELYY